MPSLAWTSMSVPGMPSDSLAIVTLGVGVHQLTANSTPYGSPTGLFAAEKLPAGSGRYWARAGAAGAATRTAARIRPARTRVADTRIMRGLLGDTAGVATSRLIGARGACRRPALHGIAHFGTEMTIPADRWRGAGE